MKFFFIQLIQQALLFSIFDPNVDWLSQNIGSILTYSILDNFKSSNKMIENDQKLFKESLQKQTDFIFTPTIEEIPVIERKKQF